jgi:hypothetical protein
MRRTRIFDANCESEIPDNAATDPPGVTVGP